MQGGNGQLMLRVICQVENESTLEYPSKFIPEELYTGYDTLTGLARFASRARIKFWP
jgi:hypothetical protein